MKVLGIIPARFASSRLPGKPLIDLGGKPMIQHVYERAIQAVDELVVATDDSRIFNAVTAFGGRVVMTSPDHTNGTSRCAEVLDVLHKSGNTCDVVINIQGDEPLLDPSLPKSLASLFTRNDVKIGTAIRRVHATAELREGAVHVVVGEQGRALYFSRSVIPFQRDIPRHRWADTYPYYHHVGIYAFRAEVLRMVAALPESPLEEAEKLEQLRWLAAGYSIHCIETTFQSVPVDTPDDVEKVRQLLNS